MNRRTLLASMASGALALPKWSLAQPAPATSASSLVYLPQSYGARADGKHLDSAAINQAIDEASKAGGGCVYLGPGTYLSGTVVLKSRVTLYLEAGAVLLGSKDIHDYTPQPGPSAGGDANQRHLLFARDTEDVTVAGPGRIDGQGKSFWVPTGRAQMPPEEQWQDVITRDWKPLPRVSPMIELVDCRHLRIEHVRVENSSGWTMRLINCRNVVIDGIAIKNPIYGINVDGIDVTNCSDVRISNCSIDTADDAICLKSENPYGHTIPATRNITVTNCTLSGCCNGFKMGTRTEGAFENITFSNSVIYNDDVPLNSRVISGICLEMVDGGSVDGVVITGIRMQRTRTPIFLRLGNRMPHKDGRAGSMRHVLMSDVVATEAIFTSSITGVPGFEVEDVQLSNIHIETLEASASAWVDRPIPEVEDGYPESRMFGRLPAWGLYCRHVRGLQLDRCSFRSREEQGTPAVVCDSVTDLDISELRSSCVAQHAPVLWFHDVSQGWVRSVAAQPGAPALLWATGAKTAGLLLTGCDLRGVSEPVKRSEETPSSAIRLEANVTA